jgi:hypothetical protein
MSANDLKKSLWIAVAISVIATFMLALSWTMNNDYANTYPKAYSQCLEQPRYVSAQFCSSEYGTDTQNYQNAQNWAIPLTISVIITIVGWITVAVLDNKLKHKTQQDKIDELTQKHKTDK